MIYVICAYVVGIALIYASYTDFKSLSIPNFIPILVLCAFVVGAVFSPDAVESYTDRAIAAGLFFVITFVMFALNTLGAGDSKLLAALGVWIPLKSLVPFLFFMACAGGVLSLISLYIIKRKSFKGLKKHSLWVAALHKEKSAVPYGIAIMFGYWMCLLQGFI